MSVLEGLCCALLAVVVDARFCDKVAPCERAVRAAVGLRCNVVVATRCVEMSVARALLCMAVCNEECMIIECMVMTTVDVHSSHPYSHPHTPLVHRLALGKQQLRTHRTPTRTLIPRLCTGLLLVSNSCALIAPLLTPSYPACAQACFWFSNGCAIGCEECDGSTRGPIPSFRCKAGTGNAGNCSVEPTPGAHITFGPKAPICAKPLNATICDPELRTVNTGAECGAADDYFYYSPWRRPGSAPVIDACGVAGGRIPGQVCHCWCPPTCAHAFDRDILTPATCPHPLTTTHRPPPTALTHHQLFLPVPPSSSLTTTITTKHNPAEFNHHNHRALVVTALRTSTRLTLRLATSEASSHPPLPALRGRQGTSLRLRGPSRRTTAVVIATVSAPRTSH
jgi:hypothetical protein